MATNISTRAALSENPDNSEKTKSKSKVSAKPSCCVCEKLIIEQTRTKKGQDAIFCEGTCQSWMHRVCTGLSLKAFKAYDGSSKPYICPHCMIESQNNEIVSLKKEIASLSRTISDMKSTQSQFQQNSEYSVSSALTYASATRQNLPQPDLAVRNVSSVNDYDRKFNVVIYGLKEPAEGTPKYQRSLSELQSVRETLESVDENLSEHAIRDCLRLGRYNVEKHRPMLVKLSRTCDVASILSKRKNLASQPAIQIRPDLPRLERATLSILLKERRKLINSDLERSSIRIKGSSIYVNGEKHGFVENSTFVATTTTTPTPPNLSRGNTPIRTDPPLESAGRSLSPPLTSHHQLDNTATQSSGDES